MALVFEADFWPGFIYQRQSLRSLAASLIPQAGLSSAIWKTGSKQLIYVEYTQNRGFSHFYKFISKIAHLRRSQFSFALLLYCRIPSWPRKSSFCENILPTSKMKTASVLWGAAMLWEQGFYKYFRWVDTDTRREISRDDSEYLCSLPGRSTSKFRAKFVLRNEI